MKLRYRTVFLSDLHLGSSGSRAKDISRLLKRIDCDTLYLVGDIIDMWRLRSKWNWPAEHNDVVRRVLKMVKKDTRVIYIPGNHDEGARQYAGLEFGGVELLIKDVHLTADGRRLLVTHGDQFDLVVKHHPLLSSLGGIAYEWLMALNRLYNVGRMRLGFRYWSLSKFIKLKVKRACTFISRFEETLVKEAERMGVEGVVCGHIHKAEHRVESGIEYFNCGDWVESCTLVVEHDDGQMEVLDGIELLQQIRDAKHRHQGKHPKHGKRAKHGKHAPVIAGAGDVLDDDDDDLEPVEVDIREPLPIAR